ncbi:MAG: GNAT family N-acetyltransferase [Armatimonadetes bacterium]|nr:GNAT family N-acetyltransferase [Armatimonadota bacterium]
MRSIRRATKVRLARMDDFGAVKELADKHRHELGFVRLSVLEEAIKGGRVFVAVNSSSVIGFVHFRCCKDGHATIYEIVVAPMWRGVGVGKALVNAVIEEARREGCSTLRLKCPIDLPSNGFYHHIGFQRVRIEQGKKRSLAVWELVLNLPCAPSWQFFVGLTSDASQIRALVRRFFEGYNRQPPFNPFERIIVSALAERTTLRLLKSWRLGDSSVLNCQFEVPSPKSLMFDSGGYQVQMGKIGYDELCRRLQEVYERETWADFYVLPDHVPTSRDADFEVEWKVKETLTMGELFLRRLSNLFSVPQNSTHAPRPIGVVHGRTIQQVIYSVRKWHELGVDYIAFGSFGTSGPNGSVNMLSKRSLKLLRAIVEEAMANEQKSPIFGIGNPTYLLKLHETNIIPASFDSTGWWKAGGFGKVFFPSSQQWHITRKSIAMSPRLNANGHDCPFCLELTILRRCRWRRVLHNLVSFAETVQKLTMGQ